MMSEMSACVKELATFSMALAATSAASMPKLLVLNLICSRHKPCGSYQLSTGMGNLKRQCCSLSPLLNQALT